MKSALFLFSLLAILTSCERSDLLKVLVSDSQTPLLIDMTLTPTTISKSGTGTALCTFSSDQTITGTFTLVINSVVFQTQSTEIGFGKSYSINIPATSLVSGRHVVIMEGVIQNQVFRKTFELFVTS